jgi:hypothetical protein
MTFCKVGIFFIALCKWETGTEIARLAKEHINSTQLTVGLTSFVYRKRQELRGVTYSLSEGAPLVQCW